MGKATVNGRAVVAPTALVRVRELKQLAGVAEHERLYDPKDGRILGEDELVSSEETTFGAVTDWTRG